MKRENTIILFLIFLYMANNKSLRLNVICVLFFAAIKSIALHNFILGF